MVLCVPPKLSGLHRQYLVAFSCQLSVMMVGSCFAWFTPLLKDLVTPDGRIPMTSDQSSWMIASIEIGELFSPIPAGILVNRWGRKTILLASFPLVGISWILVMCTNSYQAIIIVRILQGLTMGIVFTVAPIYLAEISHPKIRGALCGNFQTFWVLGVLSSFIMGPYLSYQYYAAAASSISILFLLTFIWAPESPYYLLMINKDEQAKKALTFLRASDNIDDEIVSIKNSLSSDKSHKNVRWKDLVTIKENRRALAVVTSVCFVKYMSGTVSITGYVTVIVAGTTKGQIDEYIVTILIGVVMLSASIASAYMSDKFGRKPLIFISVAGAMLFNAVTGAYFLLFRLKVPYIENYDWIAYSSIAAYCIVANVGLSPLLQTLQAECFPSKIRGHAGALISLLGTVFIFISLKQFQPLTDCFGVFSNFFSFAIYAFVGSIGIFTFMKETAGKSLEDIKG